MRPLVVACCSLFATIVGTNDSGTGCHLQILIMQHNDTANDRFHQAPICKILGYELD